MKRRVLCVQRISEEQLKYLLTHVQWLCRKDTRDFLVWHSRDLYILLRVLCDLDVIAYKDRIPFSAFVRWIEEHKVPTYHFAPKVKELRYLSSRLSNAEYPWQSQYAPKYRRKDWELLYQHFTKMVRETIEHGDMNRG